MKAVVHLGLIGVLAASAIVARRETAARTAQPVTTASLGYTFGSVLLDIRVAANQPPVVASGGPYSGLEGTPVTFHGSATDPDGDPLAVTWNFGDENAGPGAVTSHAYDDDGTYTARITATDPGGLSGNAFVQVVVGNAPPTAHVDPLPAIESGDSVSIAGGFSDPGAADGPWRFTVAWGTGAPTEGTTADQSAMLVPSSPRYCAAGHYPVRLRVVDKDGGMGQASADLIVERIAVPLVVRPSAINVGASGKVLVAIMGTPALDVHLVDPTTVRFTDGAGNDAAPVPPPIGRDAGTVEDVNGDGSPDLVLRFERQALSGITSAATTQLVLHARLSDHCREIAGSAPVRVTGARR